MLVELCFGTLLFLICFFWGFTALNGVVFQVVTSNQQNIKKNVTEKPRRWRAWEVILGLFGVLFMMFAYNFFFGENGYRRQKQEAFKIEYGEKRMLWRMSEKMTEQQMLTDMTLLAIGDTALVYWICNIPLKVYREFVNGIAQPTRSTWYSQGFGITWRLSMEGSGCRILRTN